MVGAPNTAVRFTSWSGMVNSTTRAVLCSLVSSRPVQLQLLNTLVSVSSSAVATSSVSTGTAVRSATALPSFKVTCALVTSSLFVGVKNFASRFTSWSGMVKYNTRAVLCSSVSSRPVQHLNTPVSVSSYAIALSSVSTGTASKLATSLPSFRKICAFLTSSLWVLVSGSGSGVGTLS